MASEMPVDWGQQLFPPPGGLGVGPVHGRPLLDSSETLGDRPYVALNAVSTVDGRLAVGGSAQGLGSRTDQRLMRRLRAEADAVLHGAGTLRADRFTPSVPEDLALERQASGLAPQPLGVVVSRSGLVPLTHPYFTSARPDWPRLVYGSLAVKEAVPANVEVVPGGSSVDLAAMLRDLASRGVKTVICEGGPTLNAALLAAGLVDEVFLTLSPRLVGGNDPLTLLLGDAGFGARLVLRSVFSREDELFLRYGVAR